jgi:hypothetical protein
VADADSTVAAISGGGSSITVATITIAIFLLVAAILFRSRPITCFFCFALL